MARQSTDGLYIELDYYTPENYVTYTAEGSMISGVYIDAGYIEPDFFVQNPGTTTFSITCDLTELLGETKEFEAAFSIAASLSNDAVKTVVVDSSLNTSATQSVTSTRIRQGACNFGALFTPSINAVAKINYVAILDSSASFEASANRTRDNDIALQNAVNLSLQAAKTANAVSALLSQITQTTEAARTRDTESSLAVSASVVVDVAVSLGAVVDIASSFTINVVAEKRVLLNDRPHNKLEHLLSFTIVGLPNPPYPDPRIDPTYTTDTSAFQFNVDEVSVQSKITSLEWYPDSSTSYSLGSGDWYLSFYYDKNVGTNGYNETSANTSILRLATSNGTLETIGSASPIEIAGWEYASDGTEPIDVYYDPDGQSFSRAGNLKVDVRTNSGSITLDGGAINNSFKGWVTVYRSNGVVNLIVNPYYEASPSVDDSATLTGTMRSFDVVGLYPYNRQISNRQPIIGDVIAKIGYDGGGVHNETTNDDYTLFYYPLNGTLQDETGGNWVYKGQANLSSAFSLTAAGINLANGASLQVSSGTLTATADTFSNASATLNTSATLDVQETYLVLGEASLSSAFTQTATATKTIGVASTQSVSATLAVDSIRIRDAVIDTDAIATQLAVVAKVGDFFINIEPAFTQTATAIKRVDADSALSSSFNASVEAIKVVEAQFNANTTATMPSVDVQRTRSANSVLDTIATQTATASKTIETAVAVNSAFTVTVTADKFTGNQITLGSAFTQPSTQVHRIRETALDVDIVATQTVGAIKVVEAAVAINTSATLSIQPLRIRPGVILTDAIASQLSVVAKVGNGLIALDNAFSLSVSAIVTTGNTIAISAEFTQTAQNDRIRFSSLDLDSAFTQTVDAVIGIDANANFNSSATLGVDAVAVKDASARIDGVLEFSSTVRANLVGEIPLYVDSALTATATVIKSADLALTAQFAQSVIGSKLVPASANLSSAFTQTANGKLLVFLEQLTFKIPKETRSYGIRSESRGYKINNENTTYKVRG